MGRSEYYAFDLVLPKDSIKSFRKMLTGSVSNEIWVGFFGEPSDDSDFILEDLSCSEYGCGKLSEEDEEELPKFYQDFLLKPPKGYETISVQIRIKGWFQEGIEGLLGYLKQTSDYEAILIVGGSSQSSGGGDDPYEVLFEVKGIKKLKEEKKGKGSDKESATVKCVICNEGDQSILCLPCSHVATCEECSLKSSTCPLCKANIDKRVKVLLSEVK